MRVVVTGGSGFLGSHVADALASAGHDVTVIDVRPSGQHRCVVADITDGRALQSAFKGAEAICHLAAVGDVYLAERDPALAARMNVEGAAAVCLASAHAGAAAVVYASTWEVYGQSQYEPIDESHPCDPDHPYGITKLAGERLSLTLGRMHHLRVVSLRLGTAYGTRMRPNSVFSIFIDRARRGEPLTIQGTGEQWRQFTHARDIGRAFDLASRGGRPGRVYNIVSEEATTIRRLAEVVTASVPTRIEYVPARALDVSSARVSSERAREELGWAAEITFEQGMRELIDGRRD